MWCQRQITLVARARGFHLVTTQTEVLEAMPEIGEVGLLHLLISHTSASLALNQNASARRPARFRELVQRGRPRAAPYWTHTLEGSDDMPAHIKAALSVHRYAADLRWAPGPDWAGHLSVRDAAGRSSWPRCGRG